VTLDRDGTLIALGTEPIATRHGPFLVNRFHNCTSGAPALAVTFGDVGGVAALLARVHSSCVTSEAFGACDCDCAEQLDGALAHIASHGRGVLFYLMQEGRGAGFVAKALDRMLVQASPAPLTTFEAYARLGLPADQRTYGEVAAMKRLLGVRAPLCLLSNNPDKVAALRDAGADVAGTEPLRVRTSAYSHDYLAAKARAGHTVAPTAGVDAAALPERVAVIRPEPLAPGSRLVRLAGYLLPVRGADAAWFRLHVYLDAAARRERVVLTYGSGGDDVLVRIQRETLLDRFAPTTPRFRQSWHEAVARIVAHGRGLALFADATDDLRDVAAPLLRAHAGARRPIPLEIDPGEGDDTALVRAAFAG
jgi:GTP cyclohydrolase II